MALRRFRWPVVSLVYMLALSTSSVRADASSFAPALAANELQLSEELNAALSQEASRALTWRVTWTAINGALALASVVGFWTAPQPERPTWIVGSIASSLSAVISWGFPLAIEANAESARRAASLIPKLRAARLQELYANAAEDETERVRWYWHVASVAMALVPAAILWAGYDQFQEGVMTGVAGILLGELALLTQPTGLESRPPALVAGVRASVMGRSIALSYAVTW